MLFYKVASAEDRTNVDDFALVAPSQGITLRRTRLLYARVSSDATYVNLAYHGKHPDSRSTVPRSTSTSLGTRTRNANHRRRIVRCTDNRTVSTGSHYEYEY
eukprot:scaffold71856_cov22-Prasinocladus_malaysianus.AAC.1